MAARSLRAPKVLMLTAAALLFAGAACDGGGDDNTGDDAAQTPDAAANLLVNPGFEMGSEPWFSPVADPGVTFMLSDTRARSGSYSALEMMRDAGSEQGMGATNSKVYYLVQEIPPGEFPEAVRGHYFVENWVKGLPAQYLQFVAIAVAPSNFPATQPNWQIRYVLAGTDSDPFPIGNAKFKFISREDPVQGQWVPFEINLRDDFDELWGQVPEGYETLRLLFEVRWDNKDAASGDASADVYWDDLYVGPE